jgi:lactoylglutathione lyase
MAKLRAVHPISDEDLAALPVKALDSAIAFYQRVLGFSVVARDQSTAALARDEVRIGLVARNDHEPRQAGSVAIEVDDVEMLHAELRASGGQPGELGIDDWGGRSNRTFFLREEENGYCYCFYRPVPRGDARTIPGTP